MQLSVRWHPDIYTTGNAYNLKKSLAYGLEYYYRGFSRYAHSFDSAQGLKDNLYGRSCLLPKEHHNLRNQTNTSEAGLKRHLNKKLIDPNALIMAAWSGYYNPGPGGKACRFERAIQCIPPLLQSREQQIPADYRSLLKSRSILADIMKDYSYMGKDNSFKPYKNCPWIKNDATMLKDLRVFTHKHRDLFRKYLAENSLEVLALKELLYNLKYETNVTKYLDIIRNTNYDSQVIEYPARIPQDGLIAGVADPLETPPNVRRYDFDNPHEEVEQNNEPEDEEQSEETTEVIASDKTPQELMNNRNPHAGSNSDESSNDEYKPRYIHLGSSPSEREEAKNKPIVKQPEVASIGEDQSYMDNSGNNEEQTQTRNQKYNYYIVIYRSNIRSAPHREKSTVCGNIKLVDEYPLKVVLYPDSLENRYFKISKKNIEKTIFRPNHPDCRDREFFYVHMNLVKKIPRELDTTFDVGVGSPDKGSTENRKAESRTWVWLRDQYGMSHSKEIKMLNPKTTVEILERKVLYDRKGDGYLWYKVLHPDGNIYFVYSGEEGSTDQYINYVN